ncbi:hypothetical protein [Erythrobacter donghaensis]|uniref:hypothetical protein n=1 Tax=Erythrobacter donghaensis TaxID=267135 RepID=UPI0013026375|nr:hypothetical protein [Erythrobacter donghaensis]
MREARRLALLRHQRLIAEVARKQALRTLAEARDAEARHHALAARSRALVDAAAPGAGATTGAALAARAGFTAGLARIADNARDAARDAQRQSAWQIENLAQAEARARRLTEREAEARAALAAAKERREAARDVPLARKLQSTPHT